MGGFVGIREVCEVREYLEHDVGALDLNDGEAGSGSRFDQLCVHLGVRVCVCARVRMCVRESLCVASMSACASRTLHLCLWLSCLSLSWTLLSRVRACLLRDLQCWLFVLGRFETIPASSLPAG